MVTPRRLVPVGDLEALMDAHAAARVEWATGL